LRQIILLRGVNLGPSRRVAMPALRELLEGAGYADVRTYLQSGNVVLTGPAGPAELQRRATRLIAERFGIEVPVIVRTGAELAEVVALDPLGDIAVDPKRYQVSFLSAELPAAAIAGLRALAAPAERLVVSGRELYAWHPEGVARSKLWNKLAGQGLGVTATARNWTTVTALAAMADG